MIQEKRGMLRKWNVRPGSRELLAGDFRNVHHPQWRHRERAFVRAVAGGPVVHDIFFLATGMSIYLVGTRLKDLEAKAELEAW